MSRYDRSWEQSIYFHLSQGNYFLGNIEEARKNWSDAMNLHKSVVNAPLPVEAFLMKDKESRLARQDLFAIQAEELDNLLAMINGD